MPLLESDRRLLARCTQRDPGAWEAFVDRILPVLTHVIRHTAYVRSVQLSQDDVEDLCSEVFVTILKNDFAVLKHFKGKSSLATYIAVVARRIVVKAIIQRRRSEAMGHVVAHQSALYSGGAEPSRTLSEIEEARTLINRLPASEAALVQLFYLDGKNYQQISQELGIPENSIGPTLHRARERMRQARVSTAG